MGRINDSEVRSLSKMIEPIVRKYPVEQIFLFGSRVRGDFSPDSDFDFLVVPKREMSTLNYCGLMCDLEELLGKQVDLVSSFAVDERFNDSIEPDKVLVYAI